MKTNCILDTEDRISADALSESATRLVGSNSVLVVVRSGILAHSLPVATVGTNVAFNQDIKAITPKNGLLLPEFLFWMLKARQLEILNAGVKKGATVHSLSNGFLERLPFALPPLDEQRRIVALLDRAAEIRRRVEAARAKARAIIPALFLDTFGDPASNPMGWREKSVGSLATKMSDGPFGSNLKTEHYSVDGVRVWRLQNIGVGSLQDDDKGFILDLYFKSIRRHECFPGDVIIGTLGDPNLRAIIQPPTILRAINKADCVQFRPDLTKVTAEYIMALINQPGMLARCQGHITGQTRTRISMGRLREVRAPVPPLELQIAFAEQVQRVEALARNLDAAAAKAGAMAAALSAEVFE